MSGTSDVTVRWTPETSGRAAAVQIRSRIVGDTKWTEQATGADPAAGEFRLTGVQPDANIEVQTRVRMTSGTYGPWTDNTVHTDAFTVAYGSVTGTPTSLGQINSVEAGKLSGIQAGATVGAPAGTYVGGVLAQDVASVVTNYQASSGTDTTPPAVPTGVTIASALDPDGAHAAVTIAWTAVPDSDLSVYQVQASENGFGYVDVSSGSGTTAKLIGRLPGTAIIARVRAVDRAGNASGWSAVASGTVARDGTPPAPPTNVGSSAGLSSILVSWLNPPDADLDGVIIYASPTNDVTTAAGVTSLAAIPGQGGNYSWAGLPSGYSRYIWLRALDTSGNLSGWSNVTGATTASVTQADLTPGLSAVQKVATASALPSSTGSGRLAFVADEAKTYRDTSTGWRKDVDGADLTVGSIQSAAIATSAISASKLALTGDNLFLDPYIADPSYWLGTGFAYQDAPQDWYVNNDPALTSALGCPKHWTLWGGRAAVTSYDPNGYQAFVAPVVQVQTIATYSISYALNAYSNRDVHVDLWWRDAAGAVLSGQNLLVVPAGTTANQVYHTQVTAPIGYPTISSLNLLCYVLPNGQYVSASTIVRFTGLQIRKANDASMFVDGTIAATALVADSITSREVKAGSLSGDKFSTTTSLPGTITVGSTGVTIETVRTTANKGVSDAASAAVAASTAQGRADSAYNDAQNPAAKVNAASTLIDPGKIQLQGATTLRNWMTGGDSTEIRGSAISAGSIAVNQGTFGNRAIQVNGLDFHYDQGSNSLVWGVGDVTYCNDAGNGNDGFGLNAGSCAYAGGVYYLWINRNNPTVYCQQTNNVGNPDDFQIGRWYGGQNYNITYGRTLVANDHVQTSSLQADRLVSYSITAQQLASSNLITNSAQIGDGVITNAKIGNLEVDSAKIANLTVGTNKITGNAVTVGDFVSSSSSWQGGGGVSSGTSYYTVDGVTY